MRPITTKANSPKTPRPQVRAHRTPVEWWRRRAILPPVGLCGPAAGHYEANPDFVTPEKYRNEIVPRQARAEGSVDQPHDLRLGHSGAGRRAACDVCLGRRADNYLTATGYFEGASGEILALRRPCHRQGHHAFPRHLLAGLPDVGGTALPKQIVVTASCSTVARKCRNRSATSSTRSRSQTINGVDALRYFFLREVPFGQTAIIRTSHPSSASTPISPTISANLAQRSLSMIARIATPRFRSPARFRRRFRNARQGYEAVDKTRAP